MCMHIHKGACLSLSPSHCNINCPSAIVIWNEPNKRFLAITYEKQFPLKKSELYVLKLNYRFSSTQENSELSI